MRHPAASQASLSPAHRGAPVAKSLSPALFSSGCAGSTGAAFRESSRSFYTVAGKFGWAPPLGGFRTSGGICQVLDGSRLCCGRARAQIWKKNPNLETILQIPPGGIPESASCNCQNGESEGKINDRGIVTLEAVSKLSGSHVTPDLTGSFGSFRGPSVGQARRLGGSGSGVVPVRRVISMEENDFYGRIPEGFS